MILYTTLENTGGQVLHEAFVEAFSDYQVKIDLPFWKFEQMLRRRGFCPGASIGAFDNGRLVGFVLNGLRDWSGKATAYDLGTGVVPEYRRQGITSEILSQLKRLLKGKQAEQYLLEVLKPNESAFELYIKQGFVVQREFSCFRLKKDQFVPRTACRVEMADALDLDLLKSFWDFEPSWQNSIDSVNAVPDTFAYAVARAGDDIAGYGIIDKRTGDIPQMAVGYAHRRKGVASSLLYGLVNSTQSNTISVLNVQAGYKPMEDFLSKSGFAYYVGQYEMLMSL